MSNVGFSLFQLTYLLGTWLLLMLVMVVMNPLHESRIQLRGSRERCQGLWDSLFFRRDLPKMSRKLAPLTLFLTSELLLLTRSLVQIFVCM